MTKSEKVQNWARNNNARNMGHVKTELGYYDDKQVYFLLNRLQRQGKIYFATIGRTLYVFNR